MEAMRIDLIDRATASVAARTATDIGLDEVAHSIPEPVSHLCDVVEEKLMEISGIEQPIDPSQIPYGELFEQIKNNPLVFHMGARMALGKLALSLTEYTALEKLEQQFPDIS